ncbi:hypothetical protein FO519_000621 [Halicephalobus sp. NKZ332]|nr:hypothetical protein FO519_000621 [Halicephalobus sp. NKZ332]
MNVSPAVPNGQPTDLFVVRVPDQQQCYNSVVTALLSQQQENNRSLFAAAAITNTRSPSNPHSNSVSLNSGPSSISSLSTPSCSSASLLNQPDNSPLMPNSQMNNSFQQQFIAAQTVGSPIQLNQVKQPFNLPMNLMLFNLPSTSDPAANFIIPQQQNSISQNISATSQQQRVLAQSQSQPESSNISDQGALQLPNVPKCSICGADSTGIHFGVEACAACSAFFRRTVVLNKNYLCPKDGNCPFNFESPTGQKCRACRFRKCIDVGMDKNAVQHRRDAIGKYSTTVKRECSSPMGESSYQSSSLEQQLQSPLTPKSPKLSQPTVLEELNDRYDTLNRRRKIFYCNSSVSSLFEPGELEPRELDNFGDCMFQLYRVEPRLCVEFIGKNRFLTTLSSDEKTKILTHFLLHFQAVEEPYLTWKFGGEKNRYWVMPNRTYIDLTKTDHYFDSNKAIMKELNLDKKSAVKLFQPSFNHAMETIGNTMSAIGLSKLEMVCLIGLMLFDPAIPNLVSETQQRLKVLRDQLLKDMMNYYTGMEINAELRIAHVILITSSIKVHAHKTRENMQMMKIFDIIPRDRLFDEICGLTTSSSSGINKELEDLLGFTKSSLENNSPGDL